MGQLTIKQGGEPSLYVFSIEGHMEKETPGTETPKTNTAKIETARIDNYARSDVGKYRDDNQDSVRISDPADPAQLCGIADGMGGYSHGGLASSLALEAFFNTFYNYTGQDGRQLPQTMRRGVQDANMQVYQEAQRLGVRRMGTTLTAVTIYNGLLHFAHIGDSRAYLIRDGKAACITNDHTTVGDLVRMKVLSPDKVRTHAQRSVLNKCLGLELFVQPDVSQVPLKNDDVIILCTDGIWAVVEDHEFAAATQRSSGVEDLSQKLLDLALERDSDDNVSVIAIHARQLAAQAAAVAQKGWGLPIPQFFRSRFSDKTSVD